MTKSLRTFIAELEIQSPDEIARVKKSISARYEISTVLTQLEKKKRLPLLYFENVAGHNASVIINAQATR